MTGIRDDFGVQDGVTAQLGHVTEKPHVGGLLRPRMKASKMRIEGWVNVLLTGPDDHGIEIVKYHELGMNLVTDHGDEHIGERIALDTQDIVTGMRLGTNATAASKAGAGSFIGTYLSGSQEALDAVAVGSDLGGGVGWRQAHICTWIAGDITNAAIAEVCLTDETALTDVQGTAANTVAKFIFASTIDKQAGDSLEVTWNIDVLGA